MWLCRGIVSSKILFFVHFGKGRFYLTQYSPVFLYSSNWCSWGLIDALLSDPLGYPRVSVIEIMLVHFVSAPIQAISVQVTQYCILFPVYFRFLPLNKNCISSEAVRC